MISWLGLPMGAGSLSLAGCPTLPLCLHYASCNRCFSPFLGPSYQLPNTRICVHRATVKGGLFVRGPPP